MKSKAALTTIASVLPAHGIQEFNAADVTTVVAELVKESAREETGNFAITTNVVDLNQNADTFPDDVCLSAAGTGNVTSVTNLNKIGKSFRIKNTGAGAKTITHGNNIKIFNATTNVVLLQNEYVKCYNDGTNIYVESVHHFAAQS